MGVLKEKYLRPSPLLFHPQVTTTVGIRDGCTSTPHEQALGLRFWFPGGRGGLSAGPMGHCGAGEHGKGWVLIEKPLGLSRGLLPMLGAHAWSPCLGPMLGTHDWSPCLGPILGRVPGPRKGYTPGAGWQEDRSLGHKETLSWCSWGGRYLSMLQVKGPEEGQAFVERGRGKTQQEGAERTWREAKPFPRSSMEAGEPHSQEVEYRPLQPA